MEKRKNYKIENKYLKIALAVALFFLLIFVVSADDFVLSNNHQINTPITLKQICSDCEGVNITSVVYLPTSENYLNETQMTKIGKEFVYDFVPVEVGEYRVNGFGYSGNQTETFSYTFIVVPKSPSLLRIDFSSTLGIIFLIAMVIICFVLFFLKQFTILAFFIMVFSLVLLFNGIHFLIPIVMFILSFVFLGGKK